MTQDIINLFDKFTHEKMDRDLFLKKLVLLAGSSFAATHLLSALEANYHNTTMVNPQDPTLKTDYVYYGGVNSDIKCYMARPNSDEVFPSVMIIHENRGLNPHIEDVARRTAKEGFHVIAPDALSPVGGTSKDENEARNAIGKLDVNNTVENFRRGFKYLKNLDETTEKTGAIGFCWGGGMVNKLAVNAKWMNAGVSYYGSQAPIADVPKINAKLLLQYAELDERINQGIKAYREALGKYNKSFVIRMNKGVNHAFNNNTSKARYNEKVAKEAWEVTITFLKEQLA